MRRDYFGRHMTTHIREILKADKQQVADGIENHDVVVFQQFKLTQDDGQTRIYTRFAVCLGCGKYEQSLTKAFRFQHAQWCDTCKTPMDERCETCERKSSVKQPTVNNACDDFIQAHNDSCGNHWPDVSVWFDISKPAPKFKASDRKTTRKMTTDRPPRKTIQPIVSAPAPAPAPDLMVLLQDLFPDECKPEDPESDSDDPEPRTVPDVLREVASTLSALRKHLEKQKRQTDVIVEQRVASKLATATEETRQVEQTLFATREKLTHAENNIRELNRDLKASYSTNRELQNINCAWRKQLTDAGITPEIPE